MDPEIKQDRKLAIEGLTHWEYRVCKRVVQGQEEFAIVEAYFKEDQLVAWADPWPDGNLQGDSPEEIRDELESMMNALDAEVIVGAPVEA